MSKPALLLAVVDERRRDAIEGAKKEMERIAQRYGEYLDVASRIQDGIIRTLTDAQLVEPEVKHYTVTVLIIGSSRTSRLVYEVGLQGTPLILVVPEFSDGLPDALEARHALLNEGVRVTKPIFTPAEDELLTVYIKVAKTIHDLKRGLVLQVGEYPPWRIPLRNIDHLVRRVFGALIHRFSVDDLLAKINATRVNEQLLVNSIRLLLKENASTIASIDCDAIGERVGLPSDKVAFMISHLLDEEFSVVCANDITAALTLHLLKSCGLAVVAAPHSLKDNYVIYRIYHAPLRIAESYLSRGNVRRALVAKLDDRSMKLMHCICGYAGYQRELLILEDCGECISAMPGPLHVVILNPDMKYVIALRELLGV